jgi:streptogramin lyase
MRFPAAMLLTLVAAAVCAAPPRDIRELTPTTVLNLGKTADWVAVGEDAVWVGSTGPFAVHRIDPKTNQEVARVELPAEPCAGLALGFGSLWVPLCSSPGSLARVELKTNQLRQVFPVGGPGAEGGVTTGAGSVWLITDSHGDVARIDPASGVVQGRFAVGPGSFNPYFDGRTVWISHAEGSSLAGINPDTGEIRIFRTGPHPRFLAAGGGAVFTLNQGDGSVTRLDVDSGAAKHIALNTPGHGGDIAYRDGLLWTTMAKTPLSLLDGDGGKLLCQWRGAGGDSLNIGFDAIWLTDYHAGTVARLPIKEALHRCDSTRFP